MSKQNGFTLIEMMATVSLLGILMLVAVPEAISMYNSVNRNSARKSVISSVNQAKSIAQREGAIAIYETLDGGTTYRLGVDRFPYSTPPVIEEVISTGKFPVSLSVPLISKVFFDSRGYLVDSSGSLTTKSFSLKENSSSVTSFTVYASGMITHD